MKVIRRKGVILKSPAEPKSFDFAIKIVNMNKHLVEEKKEYVISKQVLRSGTSIGANIAEAEHVQSRADFLSKMTIALKEADETKFWLRLLEATDYITHDEAVSILSDCDELIRLLASITKSLKSNDKKD